MTETKSIPYKQDQDMIDRALDEARTNNVFANLEPEPDTWQPIGGVVGKIVDKAKHNRDVRLMAEWAGYEDDDIKDHLL